MTASNKHRRKFFHNPLSGLKVIYRDLIRASEFAVKFYYGRPWETVPARHSREAARSDGRAQGAA